MICKLYTMCKPPHKMWNMNSVCDIIHHICLFREKVFSDFAFHRRSLAWVFFWWNVKNFFHVVSEVRYWLYSMHEWRDKLWIVYCDWFAVVCDLSFFTTFLLGHFRSSAPFRDVFSILSRYLSVQYYDWATLLQEEVRRGWYEGTQGRNEITKNFKNHIIGSIITSKDFLSVKIQIKNFLS